MERSRVTDEGVLKRWIALEIGRMNEGIVSERKTLATLLREENPSAITKGGVEHRFDRHALEEFARNIPADLKEKLYLPVLFHCDVEVKDSCLLADRVAMEALRSLGELSSLREFRSGGIWVSRAVVYSLAIKYPTLFQVVIR